jgi:thiol:disulfide interchange protein DsbA
MLKRLPLLCAALLALAACSNSSDTTSAPTAAPVAAATAPAPATPAPAAPASVAPAPAATATTIMAPAMASTAPAPESAVEPAPAATVASSATPFVDDGKWVEGKNYFLIEPAQPTSQPGKVEVTEVFSYGCPACNAFHATANQIAASLPANAVMTYLPASFNPPENWVMLQRAYFTAQALGVAEKGNDAMYDAVWKTRALSAMNPAGTGLKPASALPTIADAAKVYAPFGVDPKEFEAVAASFATNLKMKRADERVKALGIEQTPSMVVNGKYRYTVGSAGGYAQTVELTRWLVAKEAAGK